MKLREFLKHHKLSLRAFSKLSNLSFNQVASASLGKRRIKLAVAMKINHVTSGKVKFKDMLPKNYLEKYQLEDYDR